MININILRNYSSKKDGDLLPSADWNTSLNTIADAVAELQDKLQAIFGQGVNNPIDAGEWIKPDSITGSKIKDGVIDNYKIAKESIDGDLIIPGVIEGKHLMLHIIDSNYLAEGAVTTANIADEAVTSNEIAANTITSNNIADGTISAEKLEEYILCNVEDENGFMKETIPMSLNYYKIDRTYGLYIPLEIRIVTKGNGVYELVLGELRIPVDSATSSCPSQPLKIHVYNINRNTSSSWSYVNTYEYDEDGDSMDNMNYNNYVLYFDNSLVNATSYNG